MPRPPRSTPAGPTERLVIDTIANGGDGVGRLGEGIVVFVPRSAPGDQLEVRVARQKGFARGRIERIGVPSPSRVEPPCEHYSRDRCGGCQIQHVAYDSQLGAKATIIRDGLTRIGKRQLDLPVVEASPRQWRYRTKLTLAMRKHAGQWIAGLHPYDNPSAVFSLRDCPITDERIVGAWSEIMRASSFLPDAAELRGSVRLWGRSSDDEAHLATAIIEGGEEWPEAAVHDFFVRVPSVAALWWKGDNRPRVLSRVRTGDGEPTGAGGVSFAQVNTGVAANLRTYLLSLVRAHAPATVVDAYAGIGDTAEPIARDGARVTAIELDPDAVVQCQARLTYASRQTPASPRSIAIEGTVEDHLPAALPADVVIVNPPRTGLDARVCATLQDATTPPNALFYVSCNPATLGRDLARMSRYRIVSVRGFDMFPQTAHVETVCELTPEEAW